MRAVNDQRHIVCTALFKVLRFGPLYCVVTCCVYIYSLHFVSCCKDLEQIYWMSAGKKINGESFYRGWQRPTHCAGFFCTFCVLERSTWSTLQSISYPYFPLFIKKAACYVMPTAFIWAAYTYAILHHQCMVLV